MALTKGLTSGDSMFNSVADLQASKSRVKTIVSTNDGANIQFYTVSASDLGSGVVLDSGLFANPIGVASIADPQTATNTSDISDLEALNVWINKSANFAILAREMYQIDASSGAVDAALETSYVVGDEIIVHNESISTNLVRLTNTALTINGPAGTITPSDNLVLEPGDTVRIAMKTTTTGEVV